ncbi:hypothetical protein [Dryocola clanedunensis]
MGKIILMIVGLSLLTGCTPAIDMAEAQAQTDSQHAQVAHKAPTIIKHYNGMTIKRDKLGMVTIDGKPTTNDENTATASVYSSGLDAVIIYKNGSIAVMREGRFQDWAN